MKFISISLFIFGLGIWFVATGSEDIVSLLPNALHEPDSLSVSKSENKASMEHRDASDQVNLPDADQTTKLDVNVSVDDNKHSNETGTDKSDVTSGEITAESNINSNIDDANSEMNSNEPLILAETTADESNNLDESQSSSGITNERPVSPINPYMLGNMWMPQMNYSMNGNWMNPMFNMMMSMMSPMMNPTIYMNPMTMMNHPIGAMTQAQNLDFMMRSMDPNLMFGMFGQPSENYKNGEVPDQLPVVTIPGFPTQPYQNWPKNTVSPGISREAKKNAFTTMMAMSPLSMRDMLGIMADKVPVAEDVTWDDAVEAMKLRANEVNFKFVGSSPLWKQIEAETEKPSAKVEMFRFCDARVARKILDEIPEFIVFLPCKIALLEDAEGKLWVMTLDWDVSWLDFAQNPNNHLAKELREDAARIRKNIQYIMEGAATGDF